MGSFFDLLIVWQLTSAFFVSGELYGAFEPCCLEGVKWSGESYRCDNYPAPMPNISDSDQAACLSIIEVCCIKQTQMQKCEDGKQTAIDGDVCAIRDMEPGAEQFRECCHCCQLGLVARDTQQLCRAPNLGEPCDSKYRQCCLGEASGNFTFTDTLRSRGDKNTVSQVIDNKDPPIARQSGDQLLTSAQSTLTHSPDDSLAVRDQAEASTRTNEVSSFGDPFQGDEDEEDKDDDINECSLFDGQLCSHECVKTDSGFYCSCPPGMTLDPVDNMTCMSDATLEDMTCELNNPCEQTCIDKLEGGIECRCYPGYRLARDFVSCEDIDECQQGSAICPRGQRCVNTRGRYTCMSARCPSGYELNPLNGQCEQRGTNECNTGFAFNSVTGRCEDLNECGLGIDHCGVGQRCENTIGSYACRRERHCGTGYTLDEATQTCNDNDECLLGTHNCDPRGYDCQNIQGSFRCVRKKCPKGYNLDPVEGKCTPIECPVGMRPNDVGKCEDINECEEYGPSTCNRHQRCVNTRGSYRCRNLVNCPSGYQPGDNGCQDIDECEAGTHQCGAEQQCVNRQGSYYCQCPRGMRSDENGNCRDVDECAFGTAICPTNSQCVNTVGSFKCDCVDGLVSDGGDQCTDIDECAEEGVCQHNCVNVLGTYFCSCNRGYQLRDDKRSCEDIDECTQFGSRPGRRGVCGDRCVNMPGSFKCECSKGWRLKPDGRSCQDINECAEGSAFCPNTDSICVNTRGGYKCPVIRCPDGFLKTNTSKKQNSLRCKRMSMDCPECQRGLVSRSFNFLTFASNVLVPAPLFSMSAGHRSLRKFFSWDLDMVSARPLRVGLTSAKADDFRLERGRGFARVTLLNRIEGPQDVLLKLSMNMSSYTKGFEGLAESKIYLYVTEEDTNF
ncbi:fibulin-2 [Plakobranchus ocellatus]|uniref:Fibulin-2 n=1 Tax=Plakobranchus ocellatus TaxID=259542 RepID=A0AAV3Z0Y4_9GAST|nr:fibulin-2 [Plakobranchus ocellatus]